MMIPVIGMLPGGKERMGKLEGGEGYRRVVSVDAGVAGEVPATEAVRGGARHSVRWRSSEGGRRWVGRRAPAGRGRPIPRVGLSGGGPGRELDARVVWAAATGSVPAS